MEKRKANYKAVYHVRGKHNAYKESLQNNGLTETYKGKENL